jgi:hypothetical protein
LKTFGGELEIRVCRAERKPESGRPVIEVLRILLFIYADR